MFTPYYILAVAFGLFAVIVAVIGIKNPDNFPGRFFAPLVALGLIIGVSTVVMVWRGGDEEVATPEHKEQVQQVRDAVKAMGTGTINPLPAGLRLPF